MNRENILKRLMAEALELGACGLLNGIGTEEFARLIETAQGREFCAAHDWPGTESLRGLENDCLRGMGIIAESCAVAGPGVYNVLITGKKTMVAVIMSGTAALHHVVAVDGAEVMVYAGDYAVGSVEVSGTAKARIINTDGTARVRIV